MNINLFMLFVFVLRIAWRTKKTENY